MSQIRTAAPWGPTPPGNPLVPGSPWKQTKTLDVCKTSNMVAQNLDSITEQQAHTSVDAKEKVK